MECSRVRGTDQGGGRPSGAGVVPRFCLVLQAEKDLIPGERESGRTSWVDPSAYVAVTFQCSSLYPLSKRKSMFLRHDVLTRAEVV